MGVLTVAALNFVPLQILYRKLDTLTIITSSPNTCVQLVQHAVVSMLWSFDIAVVLRHGNRAPKRVRRINNVTEAHCRSSNIAGQARTATLRWAANAYL